METNNQQLKEAAVPRSAVVALAVIASLSSHAHAACSVATLNGQYVLSGRGFIEPGDPGVPRVHRGILVFDGAGKVSGKQTSSRAGKIGHETPQGTYTVNENCSGTMTFGSVAKQGSQIHWDTYISEDARFVEMIRTDDGSMAVRSLRK